MKRSVTILTTALLALILAGRAHAATLIVEPGQSIQSYIDAAAAGDTILVLNGVYFGEGNYNIDFGGKAITLRSVAGPTLCIIAAQGGHANPRRAFIFQSGEGADSIIDGLTITGGFLVDEIGAGILCTGGSSPTIRNCTIVSNIAWGPLGAGGAIACIDSSPTIENNRITANHADGSYGGGGIYCFGSNATITQNTIRENTTFYDGGGIYAIFGAPEANLNTIEGNEAIRGAGMCNWLSASEISNNLFIRNQGRDFGGGLYCRYDPAPKIVNNTLTENLLTGGGEVSPYGREIAFYGINAGISNSIVVLNEDAVEELTAPPERVVVGTGTPIIGEPDDRGLSDPAVSDWTMHEPPVLAGFHVVRIVRLIMLGGDLVTLVSTHSIAEVQPAALILISSVETGDGLVEGTYWIEEPQAGIGDLGEIADISIHQLSNVVMHYSLFSGSVHKESGSFYAELENVKITGLLDPVAVFVAPSTLEDPGTPDDPDDDVFTLGTDYHLTAGTSPAIDAGDITSDYSNEPYPNGGRINDGRYGNTEEAATSPSGAIIVEGPNDYTGVGSGVVITPAATTVRIDISAENLLGFGTTQMRHRLYDVDGTRVDGFDISTTGGDATYGGLAVVVPEDGGFFPAIATGRKVYDTTAGRRTVGFILDDDVDIGPDLAAQPRTILMRITYDLPPALPDGTYTVTLDPLYTVVASASGPIAYQTETGSFTINVSASGCLGDLNDDGSVNVLDMIVIRNNLNELAESSPGAEAADLNGDGIVNVLDMITVRNNLGACP